MRRGRRGPCVVDDDLRFSDERETFTVESGVLMVWCDDVLTELCAGQTLSVAARARHRFKNPGPDPVVVLVAFDGTRNEDAHIPVATHFAGRALRPRDLARMFVHDAEIGASLAAWEPFNALQRLFARVMKRLGVEPFPLVEDWVRPETTSSL